MTNDKMYSEKKISEYLNELASKSPVPGGGSAAALVGAVGTALINKVANFTIGKEKYKAVEKETKDILYRSEEIRKNFIKFCSEDSIAYKKLRDAFKLPQGDKKRTSKIQYALKEAMGVPLEICKNACEAIKLCMPLARNGNVNLITDVGCASFMLHCAFGAALLNININLKSIEDNEFILEIRQVLEPMEKEISSINEEVKGEVERILVEG